MAATVQPKVFKKYEIIEGGGHHGGGWKVAYADFMTAMMAFFLLMWILASSDEQKLRGIAEYFTNATLPGGSGVLDGATLGPPGTLTASNGAIVARGSENGKIDDMTPAQWEVRDVTATADPNEENPGTNEGVHDNPVGGAASDIAAEGQKENPAVGVASAQGAGESPDTLAGAGKSEASRQAASGADPHAADDKKFEELKAEILQAMQESPELRTLEKNVIFEQTPEGLHIQIVDQEGKPMFASGRAAMTNDFQTLLGRMGQSLSEISNPVILSGHTDAVPFAPGADYDNWDLSSDRANATRRVFEGAGVSKDRILRVSGLADTKPLVPENPTDASNRRISILVKYEETKRRSAAPRKAAKPEAAPAPQQASPSPVTGAPTEKRAEAAPAQQAPAPEAPEATRMAQEQVVLNLRNALR